MICDVITSHLSIASAIGGASRYDRGTLVTQGPVKAHDSTTQFNWVAAFKESCHPNRPKWPSGHMIGSPCRPAPETSPKMVKSGGLIFERRSDRAGKAERRREKNFFYLKKKKIERKIA